MIIWLLKDGELLPTNGDNTRLFRAGMIADMLVKQGHEVIWWTSSFNHFKKQFISTSNQDLNITSNYVIKLLHGPGYKKNISLRRILHNRIIAKKFLQSAIMEKKPDIILASLPTIELALAATEYGKQHNVKVILDLRDLWPDIMVEVMPKFFRPIARKMLFWHFREIENACKNATGMIGITKEFLQWGLNYAKRECSRFDAVYPIAYSNYKPDIAVLDEASKFWQHYGITANRSDFIVSFVGTVHRSFQLDIAVEAAQKVDGMKLVIAGIGPEFNRYKKLLTNSKYKNIILPGWIDRSKIYYLLKLSNIGLAPYIERKDTLMAVPNKIAEYLSFGLPILVNNRGVIKTLLEQNYCGIYYKNADDLVRLMNKCIKDISFVESMSRAAYALYEREFMAEKVYLDMSKYLENIVSI